MPISRLRLQIAGWTAAIFLLALGAADVALFSWLRGDADRRFSRQIELASVDLGQAVLRELRETPSHLDTATSEALKEWPAADPDGFVVYDSAGRVVLTRGPDSLARRVPPLTHVPSVGRAWSIPLGTEDLRLAASRPASRPPFTVVAFQPTGALRASLSSLAWWLTLSAPLVVLMALAGGYVLSQRALLKNRRFLGAVAHQLRTPLTVIRGETDLSLDKPRNADEYRDVLRRVAIAAEQMSRRVDDLFVLAAAESGGRATLTEDVELDGLVLECADLMRQRAASQGRRLELGTVEPAVVRGDGQLIREATLELMENAIRHGDAKDPIRLAAHTNGRGAVIEVSNRGAPIAPAALAGDPKGPADTRGLGLAVVRVIAQLHGGHLSCRRDGATNTLTLSLPSLRGEQ